MPEMRPENRTQPAPAGHGHRMVTHHDRIFEKPVPVIQGGSFAFVITDQSGIHARPAGVIVSIAKKHNCEITIAAGEKTCSAGSLVDLMSLGAAQGTRLEVRAAGPDAEAALNELFTYMKENL